MSKGSAIASTTRARERAGRRRLLDRDLQHRELVAAQPRDDVALAARSDAGAATARSSSSPIGWPSVSFTLLEAVEIEAAAPPLLVRARLRRAPPPSARGTTRGSAGRSARRGAPCADALLGAAALGDVLDQRHPSAAGDRAKSIAKVRPRDIWRSRRNGSPRAIMSARRRLTSSSCDAGKFPCAAEIRNEFGHRHADARDLRREVVHFEEALVVSTTRCSASTMHRPCDMLASATSCSASNSLS